MENKVITSGSATTINKDDVCYYQTLHKAVDGFAKALELRKWRMSEVTARDILDYTDVDRKEFDFLFEEPSKLFDSMTEEILDIFTKDIKLLQDLDSDLILTSIFKRLQKLPASINILCNTGNHAIWADALRSIIPSLTQSWPPEDAPLYEYIYRNFCCQFALTLERWCQTDFSSEEIKGNIRLLSIWIEADTMIADATGDGFDQE